MFAIFFVGVAAFTAMKWLLMILCSLQFVITTAHNNSPDPTWLNNFTVNFDVFVKQYGSNWNSTGILYYNWTRKVATSVTTLYSVSPDD